MLFDVTLFGVILFLADAGSILRQGIDTAVATVLDSGRAFFRDHALSIKLSAWKNIAQILFRIRAVSKIRRLEYLKKRLRVAKSFYNLRITSTIWLLLVRQ
jgi:hypothetical protein